MYDQYPFCGFARKCNVALFSATSSYRLLLVLIVFASFALCLMIPGIYQQVFIDHGLHVCSAENNKCKEKTFLFNRATYMPAAGSPEIGYWYAERRSRPRVYLFFMNRFCYLGARIFKGVFDLKIGWRNLHIEIAARN